MEELLSDYGADVGAMRTAADQVSSGAGDVENLGDEVRAGHVPAQEGVAGLLEGPTRSAPLPVTLGAFALMQRSLIGGGVVRVFANAVSAYNTEVASLRDRWEALSADEQEARRGSFEASRQALEDELDASATEAVALLAGEPTDEVLTRLWNQGALPLGAERAFPDSQFVSQVDPNERWEAVSAEYFPEQVDENGVSEGITEERVRDLELTDESVAELLVLLDVTRPLQYAEVLLLARLGEFDSQTVIDAADDVEDAPGGETLAAIRDGTSTLERINDRTSLSDPLTEAEKAYLIGWFGHTPDEVFRDLPNAVDDAIQRSMLGVPYADEDTYFVQTRRTYLNPVADAMLNFSNPEVGGGLELGLPALHNEFEPLAIDDFRRIAIGVPPRPWTVAEQGGYPHPLAEQGFAHPLDIEDEGTHPVYVLGPPTRHEDATSTLDHVEAWRQDPDVAVPNLERLEGFAHLIDASTVPGGDNFMRRLAEHADLIEQQLDELPESHEESLAATFQGLLGDDGEYMGLTPDELGEHFAAEDRLVEKINDQLGPLMSRGHDAVGVIRSVVERYSA